MIASEQAMATILKVSALTAFAFDALPICKFYRSKYTCFLFSETTAVRSLSQYVDLKYLRDLRAWKKSGMKNFVDSPFTIAKELHVRAPGSS